MKFSFTSKPRGKEKPEELREQGIIPGVLYGPEIESVSIQSDYKDFEKLYQEVGSSNLIDLTIEGTKEPFIVLVQEVQRDLIKQRITHFDLRQIKMGEEMTATITLNLIGESVAVKELGGTLSTPLNSLNVKCLPKDLVSDIEVDISVLATFDDAVYIKDLKLPEGITVTDNVDTLIAKVVAPLTEEQLKALEEAEAAPVEEIAVEGEEGVEEGAEEGEKEGEEKKEEGAEEKKEEEGEKKE